MGGDAIRLDDRVAADFHNRWRLKMAHIALPEGIPGIVGPMIAYPETQVHLSGLAEALLRGPSSLTSAERELIASYVSSGNSATSARNRMRRRPAFISARNAGSSIRSSPTRLPAPVSPKMKALLAIADKVRRDGRLVETADVERARAEARTTRRSTIRC